MYYEPWDWVIAAGAYEDEFLKSQREIAAISCAGGIRMLMMLGLTLLATVGAWYALALGLGRKIGSAIDNLRAAAAAWERRRKPHSRRRPLAEVPNQPRPNIEETRGTVEFIASDDRAQQSPAPRRPQLVKSATKVTEESLTPMQRMRRGDRRDQGTSSDQMARIIRTTTIAFQDELAFERAVEAARPARRAGFRRRLLARLRSLAQRKCRGRAQHGRADRARMRRGRHTVSG